MTWLEKHQAQEKEEGRCGGGGVGGFCGSAGAAAGWGMQAMEPWSHGRIVGRPSGLPAAQVVTDEPIAETRAHTRLGANSQIHGQGRAALRPDLSKLLACTGGRLETGQGGRTAHWLEDRRILVRLEAWNVCQRPAFGSESTAVHGSPTHQFTSLLLVCAFAPRHPSVLST